MKPVSNTLIYSQPSTSTTPPQKKDVLSFIVSTSKVSNVTQDKVRSQSLPYWSNKHFPSALSRQLSTSSLATVPKRFLTDADLEHFSTTELLYSDSFFKTANKYNAIIALRTPSEIGRMLLQEGFPTKNFHVKAKSSVTGPTAGFIAVDERLSKAKPEKQKKFIEEAISKGSKKIDLVLSKPYIKHLLEEEHIIQKEGGNNDFIANYQYIDNLEFHIDDKGAVFYKSDNKPVQVLSNAPLINKTSDIIIDDKPITADYDLFAIIPSKNQANNVTPMTVKPYLNSKDLNSKNLEFLSTNTSGMDRDKGNLSHFSSVIINDINENVKENYKGGTLVWHGEESNNPFSEGFDIKDQPIFIIPHTNKTIQIKSKDEISQLYALFEERGYQPEYTPRLSISRKSSLSSSITDGTFRSRGRSSVSDAGSSISRTSVSSIVLRQEVTKETYRIAKNLLDKGVEHNMVMSVTGLSLAQLDNLRELNEQQ